MCLAIAVLLSMSANVSAQALWSAEKVIQVPGKTADEIAACAENWLAVELAQLGAEVTRVGDEVIAPLIIDFKINNITYSAGSGLLTGKVTIKCRDGRCKIIMDDFRHASTNPQYSDWWSMGTILQETPEAWQKGLKWKQKREVYKRVLEYLEKNSGQLFVNAESGIPACSAAKSSSNDDW